MNIGESAFSRCSGLTSVFIPNSVTSINDGAFSDCGGLTSITIPNSVTSIGNNAFNNCTGLTSITIPNSVTNIGQSAFANCSNLTSIDIPNSVTNIGSNAFDGTAWLNVQPSGLLYIGKVAYKFRGTMPNGTSIAIADGTKSISALAFYDCYGLSSIDIPNSVTSVGNNAFYGTSWLNNQPDGLVYAGKVAYKYKGTRTSIVIADGTKSISEYAFQNCSSLTSITIPNSVTSIGDGAFEGCSGLTSVTIPNSVTSIGSSAFANCSSLNTVRLGDNIKFIGDAAFKNVTDNNRTFKFYVNDNTLTFLSLWTSNDYIREPEIHYIYYPWFFQPYKDYIYENGTEKQFMSFVEVSSTSIRNKLRLENGVQYVGQWWKVNQGNTGHYYTTKDVCFTGLDPNTTYFLDYIIRIRDIEGMVYTYSMQTEECKTATLTFTTQQPKVISEGNVIVSAKSNLDDEETNIGFEWRRTDWTDDFDSKSGGAYLYAGTMEGYIRSINSNYLWKFRPYYTSNAGNTYYGDWKGMDPSDFSYFEHTIYTYSTVNVTGNRAEVKGYVMRGTDRVTSQGFMYWKNTSSYSLRKKAAYVPAGATTVEATGNVMNAVFEDLDYETEYCYVAFVKTEENEMFYGEVQTFSTNVDPDGIEDVKAAKDVTEIARYDIQGRKLDKPQKGINIIRYSDGTSRKVLVK